MHFKTIFNNNIFKYLFLPLLLSFFVFISFYSQGIKPNFYEIKSYISSMEGKTFDLRQVLISKNKKVNKDIVIIGIDNVSQEFLTDYYGTWPISRAVYADIINYIENDKPIAIGLDIVFINSWNKSPEADNKLINSFTKYDNVYTAMLFDDYSPEQRKPVMLPDYLKANIESKSTDFEPYMAPNMQGILAGITNNSSNVGSININRNNDGIIRNLPLFWGYPQYKSVNNKYEIENIDYYPNFGLKLLTKYLQTKEGLKNTNKYIIDKNNNLLIANKKIPLNNRGEAILNWYGEGSRNNTKTFTFVPFKDIFVSMKASKDGNKTLLPKGFFKDKIIILGYTANGLYDIKSVPTDKEFPACEIYATFINNVFDNNIIVKNKLSFDILVSLLLGIIVAFLVYKGKSVFTYSILSIFIAVSYILISILLMKYYNLWIWVFVPVMTIIFSFIIASVIKYFVKSKDYEYAYKLATIDGLTGLYNHRFFIEQMELQIITCARYKMPFSLLLIDIDDFKAVNDIYGHLSGDAVLRQLSKLLKKSIRLSDRVFRYGGEELAIILPNTDYDGAIILAERICKIVSSNIFKLPKNISKNITISLGVSNYPDNGFTTNELLDYADKALYNAKENGKNQVGKQIK